MKSSCKTVSLKPRMIISSSSKKSNLHFLQQFSVFSVLLWEICVHCLTNWLLLYPCRSLLRGNMYLRRGGGSMICWCESNCFVGGSEREKKKRPLNSCAWRKRSKIGIKFDLLLGFFEIFFPL